MTSVQKRTLELRMIVIVLVDLTEPGLTEALSGFGRTPMSIADVLSSEVISNLESVSYVDSVVVSHI
jgi:hypothetical protein